MQFYKIKNLRKTAVTLVALLGLTAILLITTFVANISNKQDIRSKAAEPLVNSPTGGSLSDMVISNLIMPSVKGFTSDAFTGNASVSYSFEIPKGRGLAPQVGLSYSSSGVADYGVGLGPDGPKYPAFSSQADVAGYGWQITGGGYIARSRENDTTDSFTINLGGVSYSLIKDPSDGDSWHTSPESQLKIKHGINQCPGVAQDTDMWQVWDKSGTWYVFGGQTGSNCTFVTAGDQFKSTAWRYTKKNLSGLSNLKGYKWYLRYAQDVHGNSIGYSYHQEYKNIVDCSQYGDNHYPVDLTNPSFPPVDGFNKYTTAVYLDAIDYGNNRIEFSYGNQPGDYSDRPDWKLKNWDERCAENYFSHKRLINVTSKFNGQVYSSYDLNYQPSKVNQWHWTDDTQTDLQKKYFTHSLLQSIVRHGTGGNGSLPAYSFTYSDGDSGDWGGYVNPYKILLKTATNGYGGMVTFNYEDAFYVNRCDLTNANCELSGRVRVKTRDIKDDVTDKSYTIAYDYSNGLAKYNLKNTDGSLEGYEFLGFGKVLEKTSSYNSTTNWLKLVRTSFHQTLVTTVSYGGQSSACLNPDVRKGKPYLTEVLDTNGTLDSGTVLTKTATTYDLSYIQECKPWAYDVTVGTFNYIGLIHYIQPMALTGQVNTTTYGPSGQKTTSVGYDYDQYGNTTKESNSGFTDISGDEKYTLTKYTYNTTRNILDKPYATALTSDAKGCNALSVSVTYYDSHTNLTDPPDKGDATKVITGGSNPFRTSTCPAASSDFQSDELGLPENYAADGTLTENLDAPNEPDIDSSPMAIGSPDTVLGITDTSGADTLVVAGGTSPTPYLIVKTVNSAGTPIPVQKLSKVNCSVAPCTVGTNQTNVSTATFNTAGANLIGGGINDPAYSVIGITPAPVAGTSYPACRGLTDGTRCYVWPSWKTGSRTVTYVIATPTVTVIPSLTNVPPTKAPTPTKIPTATPTITLTPSPSPYPTTAKSAVVNNTYDSYGNLVKSTSPRNANWITTTTYDWTKTLPETVTIPKPFSWVTTTYYDPILRKPNQTIDQNGVATNIRYDNFGRVLKAWDPDDSESQPTVKTQYYDEIPMKVRIDVLVDKGSNKYTTSYSFYDGFGQKIEEQKQWDNGKISVSYTTYNSLGQVKTTYTPYLTAISNYGNGSSFIPEATVITGTGDKKTVNQYDQLGRSTKVTNPDGTKVNTDYDINKTTVYDANDPDKNGHNKKITTTDGQGQIIKIEEYKDGAIYLTQSSTYDAAGRLKTATDPGGHVSSYKYSILGHKISETNPDSGTTKYVYDPAGNVILKTDNTNKTILMTYDILNRVRYRRYPSGSVDSYYYDGNGIWVLSGTPTPTVIPNQKGKLTYAWNKNATNKYVYDIYGQLKSQSKTITGDSTVYTTGYTYDDANRLSKIKYPDGEEVTQTYTDSSLPKTLSGINSYITDSVYNVQGQLTSRKFGNNTTLTQNYYDANYRLKDIILDSPVAQNGNVAGAETENPPNAIHQQYYYPTPKPNIFDTIISFFKTH